MTFFILLVFPLSLFAKEIDTPLGRVQIEAIVTGLDEPWSLAFLLKGYLITERSGRLLYFDGNGQSKVIKGVPKAQQGGQAGLFDVLVPKNYLQTNQIFLSYAHLDGRGTAVTRARLDLENTRLTDQQEIFVMNSPSRSKVHFGGRLVEADDDHIFLTLGERGDRNLAQDMGVDNGSVVRIRRDGSGYEIWSKGHRNPQGAALDAQGQLWITEHGAKGGDELNNPQKGRNYGWPVISYGVNYDGSKIGEGYAKAGLEQPAFYWDPSIAPSGLAIHSGKNRPQAKGVFFAGALKFSEIALVQKGSPFQQIGAIKSPETQRVRDVREAPDGSIWFLSVVNGAAYRMSLAQQ